ncbi:MAG TPA: glycoside hydrolase family 1 protein [Candidatus Onthocola gallistercoris]|uniref:Glycoside hydrolase family 1 protein n=1 Tax=Candidatus Onthocola gallistercoris TaxID=2840876 RepID=A0A9D1HE92_9FIRM|nr:glycoside hydrolase family 1 protein [Candidatus Onthocola gallistercoris]
MEQMCRADFPKDFLWGSASAAYQIEGGWKEGGKGMTNWDAFVRIPGKTYKGTTGDVAADHYHRYKEDIALMAELGLKTYRFSICWARIFPKGVGEVNKEGIAFYQNVIDECLKYGIEPMVTIFHWDLPQALVDAYQGWESPKIVDDFVRYAKTLFTYFGDKVKYWITLNEQNIFTTLGWLTAQHPPGKFDAWKTFYQVNHHAFMAHAKTVLAYRQMGGTGMIGASFAYTPSYSMDCRPENAMAKANYDDLQNYWWMDVYAYGRYPVAAMNYLKQKGIEPKMAEGDEEILKKAAAQISFMGVNYYKSCVCAYNPPDGVTFHGRINTTGEKGSGQEVGIPGIYRNPANPYLLTTDWDWSIDPSGLWFCCREITSRYALPIIISENGLGAFDVKTEDDQIHDEYRIEYLKEHLKALREAIGEGCKVIAYCTWSFTDLLSWLNGYQKRYGLVYVDRDEEEGGSLQRFKKDSFYWYKQVIETNGTCL